jgi:hypothetical protein
MIVSQGTLNLKLVLVALVKRDPTCEAQASEACVMNLERLKDVK